MQDDFAPSLLAAQPLQAEATFRPASNSQANSEPATQSSIEMLKQLASEQILRDPELLGKTRFKVDPQDKTYFYDPTPAPAAYVLLDKDPFEAPLEALIRVDALRRDFESFVPNDDFWVSPLEAIEQVVDSCVSTVEASQSEQRKEAPQQVCTTRIQVKFDSLGAAISDYAAAQKLSFSEPAQTRDPAVGYRVQVKIDPPKARVKVMPLLEYKKYQYFKVPTDQYRWNDLLDSENDLIGWYHYRAEWPPELNGPEEGDFCIKKPGVITFTPAPKAHAQ